ncbi:hypothetical protein PG988_003039 [Apiospora saccharicola]
MKVSQALLALTAITQYANAAAVPISEDASLESRSQENQHSNTEDLWKRKGGGGGGGRGGGSSSGGSSSGGSSSSGGRGGGSSSGGSSSSGGGSSSSGGGSSSSGGSSSGGKGGSSSSPGGSTGGTGSTGGGSTGGRGGGSTGGGSTGGGSTGGGGSNFGGGQYYGGGARQSYSPGGRSPSGIVPGLLIGSAIGLGAGAFLYGAYSYPYHDKFEYFNATTNRKETKPVECLCDKYSDCGCDDNGDKKYLNDIIGNGTYEGLNKSVVNIGEINGKQTIIINGTIPNDTSSDSSSSDNNANAGIDMHSLLHTAGWWPVVATGFAIAYAV